MDQTAALNETLKMATEKIIRLEEELSEAKRKISSAIVYYRTNPHSQQWRMIEILEGRERY